MEFNKIGPPLFKVEEPKDPYPTQEPDRQGNLNSSDVDFSKVGSFSPQQVKQLHYRSDVDGSPKAQHHTLGTGRNQASSGVHTHDGTTSRKLGTGLGLVLTGAKGGNVALTNLINMLKNWIEFTDSTT